jgi:TonB-dependent SusC/RagA subfamily outer membrane receptor
MIIPVANFKTLGIADLNTHDVNSITILKDASSTALYGYLGGNGVIIIDTKKGGGETKFNFGIKKGYQCFLEAIPPYGFGNLSEHSGFE